MVWLLMDSICQLRLRKRGIKKSKSIANFSFRLGEYTNDSLSPSKLFRANTFKNEASTNFLIYGVVDVYGKRVSIGVDNLHDADITIDSWVIYGIRGR